MVFADASRVRQVGTTSEVAVELPPEEQAKSFNRRTAHKWEEKRRNVLPMARQNVFLEVDCEIDAELGADMYYRERGRRGFLDEDGFIFVKFDIEKEAVLDQGGDYKGKTVAIAKSSS